MVALTRILPTRNGNCYKTLPLLDYTRHTDPTYKEWKQSYIDRIRNLRTAHGSCLQGMETAMGGDFHVAPIHIHGSYLQGMETEIIIALCLHLRIYTDPTYKEWKLSHVSFRFLCNIVHTRILPTRNGNNKTAEDKAEALAHGSYLQGMETW